MTRHAQELIRPLPVVLRPQPDELLSSWLKRHAAYYGVTRRRMLDHVGILPLSVEALDREITLGQQIMLAGYFRRQPCEIAAMSYETVRTSMCTLIRSSAPQHRAVRLAPRKASAATRRAPSARAGCRAGGLPAGFAAADSRTTTTRKWLKPVLNDFRTIGIWLLTVKACSKSMRQRSMRPERRRYRLQFFYVFRAGLAPENYPTATEFPGC